jgi:spermidine synthase
MAMVSLPPWSAQVLALGAFKLRAETPETLLGNDAFVEARKGTLSVLFHADGPNTSATIFDDEGSRALYVNGKANGNDKFDYMTMGFAALIPALLAERAERVFVVGYGLGITVGELAALDSIESVTVAEISRSVMEGAPFFDDSNLGARKSPKVEIVQGDAYRALLRGEGLYDLIVSEPSHPWVLGVEMVYSQEFLEQARARLHPHGVYVQWIHRYDINSKTIDLVLSTYTSVFEDVSIWYAFGGDLLLVGFNQKRGADSLDRLIERASRSDVMEAFERLNLSSISGFLAHEIVPVGVLSREHLPETVHTLQHPRLSHEAAKAFFRDPPQPPIPKNLSAGALRAGANNSLARRYAENLDATDLEAHREAMVSETCKYLIAECIVLLSEWLAESPESPALHRLANELHNDPDLTRSLSSGVPRVISTLFDHSSDNLPESLSVEEARFWESTFFTNYEYAAPFDLEVLPEIWRRCVDEDPALCEEGVREIEQKLK